MRELRQEASKTRKSKIQIGKRVKILYPMMIPPTLRRGWGGKDKKEK
jgi:hypothetical protein